MLAVPRKDGAAAAAAAATAAAADAAAAATSAPAARCCRANPACACAAPAAITRLRGARSRFRRRPFLAAFRAAGAFLTLAGRSAGGGVVSGDRTRSGVTSTPAP